MKVRFDAIEGNVDGGIVHAVRHTHMMLAVFPEGMSWSERDVGTLEQIETEVHAAAVFRNDAWKHIVRTIWLHILEHMRDSIEAFADQRPARRQDLLHIAQMCCPLRQGRNRSDL